MLQRIGQRRPGLQNPDESLRARIGQALCATGHLRLRNLKVRVRNGHVVLEGCVSSWYSKQLAQTAALSVHGITSLRNDLDVCRKPLAAAREENA